MNQKGVRGIRIHVYKTLENANSFIKKESRSAVPLAEGCGEKIREVINKKHEKTLGGERYTFLLLVVDSDRFMDIYI